jgi:hypothetical protein
MICWSNSVAIRSEQANKLTDGLGVLLLLLAGVGGLAMVVGWVIGG